MASLFDRSCIAINYGWNDPFLKWEYKSGSLKITDFLLRSLPQTDYFMINTWKNNFHSYYPPTSNTTADSDDKSNYDSCCFDTISRRMCVTWHLHKVFKASRRWVLMSVPDRPTSALLRMNTENSYPVPIQHYQLENKHPMTKTKGL